MNPQKFSQFAGFPKTLLCESPGRAAVLLTVEKGGAVCCQPMRFNQLSRQANEADFLTVGVPYTGQKWAKKALLVAPFGRLTSCPKPCVKSLIIK